MPSGITTFNDITPAIRNVYNREMLEVAKKEQVYSLFANTDSVPTRNGDGMEWDRYDPFPVVDTPLTDGVYGAPRKAVRRPIIAKLDVYGDYSKLTKKMVRTNLEDVTMQYVQRFGQQAGETMDTLMRDTIYSGVSYLNCANGVTGTPGTLTEITTTDLGIAVKQLKTNNAKLLASTLVAGRGIGTAPVAKSYFCFVHTDMRDDVRAMDNFQKVETYSMQKSVYENELGAVDDVRFIETSNGKLTGSTYSCFIVAKNSYGTIDLSGNAYNVYRHGFGSAGSEDPHSMFMSIGWDAYWGGVVLNDNWLVDLRCVHT